MKPNLELAGAGVMPYLVVELGVAEMKLEQPAVAAGPFEAAVGLWQPRLEAPAQPAKEIRWRERSRVYQPSGIYGLGGW